MTTIEFSLIPDADSDYLTVERLMTEFKNETGIDVQIKRMEWEDAWPQLIGIAIQGQGVDVSHVGSTWVSSLWNMNALRPMPSHLINKVGSEQAFVHSTWSSVISEEDRHAFGIPLSAYVYIVASKGSQSRTRQGETATGEGHAVVAEVVPGSYEDWCDEHGVPETQCTRCDPSLIPAFQAANDWCADHVLPMSQCTIHDPNLKIVRPPKPEGK